MSVGAFRAGPRDGRPNGRELSTCVHARRPRRERSAVAATAVYILLGCSSMVVARGAKIVGVLPQQDYFTEYVGKFCFDYKNSSEVVGLLTVKIEQVFEPTSAKLVLMLFDDEKSHWRSIRRRWQSATCEEKKAAASLWNEIDLNPRTPSWTKTIRIREKVRPRFWFFLFEACGNGPSSTLLRYDVHSENVLLGWESEFSLDHSGLFFWYKVFALAWGIATVVLYRMTKRCAVEGTGLPLKEHPHVRLLLLSFGASLASCILFLGHYTLFLHDGFGSKRIRFLAVVAAVIANCTLFLISILSSVGWAISTAVLPNRRLYLALIVAIGGLSALTELRVETTVDQSTKLYSYQSGPGVFNLMLKIFMFCWFAYQAKTSYEEELDDKRRQFYKWLGTGVSLWAVSVPITVMLAFEISPWCRYRLVTVVDLFARFLGQAMLAQIFCGPLSPLNAQNVLFLAAPGSQGVSMEEGIPFDHLNDGGTFQF